MNTKEMQNIDGEFERICAIEDKDRQFAALLEREDGQIAEANYLARIANIKSIDAARELAHKNSIDTKLAGVAGLIGSAVGAGALAYEVHTGDHFGGLYSVPLLASAIGAGVIASIGSYVIGRYFAKDVKKLDAQLETI